MSSSLIEIPVPGLVVLVGAAGAGKSTLASRLFAPSEILSSDALRAAISGDAADQRATRPAFAILHREVLRRLASGSLVVVDATNVEPAARRTLVRLARVAGVPALAIVIVPLPTDVHARNERRSGRVVPRDIVDRHLRRVAELGGEPADVVAALRAEGFARVRVLTTIEELDNVMIDRRSGG